MHSKNKHQSKYDFHLLCEASPILGRYVFINQFGLETIDFADPEAVLALNEAILKKDYQVTWWQIPKDFLCPPIPGRADYIHEVGDLLKSSFDRLPTGKMIKVLDVGVGANCIYPIIGVAEYNWNFIGSDVEKGAILSAQKIVDNNHHLTSKVELRMQKNRKHIFQGLLTKDEIIDVTICNPPFHSSEKEAHSASQRKIKNLGLKNNQLNFGGVHHELWCEGGEQSFILNMIHESSLISHQCLWFTTLVSKKEHIVFFKNKLHFFNPKIVKIIEMNQGNKKSTILAWSFFDYLEHKKWGLKRWT